MDNIYVKPAVDFQMAGVFSDSGSLPQLPQTIVIFVNGIIGPSGQSWMPGWSLQQLVGLPVSAVKYHASSIIGREVSVVDGFDAQARQLLGEARKIASSGHFIAFWADDIGGSLVKQALATAVQDADTYEGIVDATATVVFCGTPHRGSATWSLDSTIHSIIETGFSNILGDWFPETLNTLCRHIEDVNQQFSNIRHKFSVINYYQRATTLPVPSFRVIVPYECATFGDESEINLGVDRTHNRLSMLDNTEARAARSYLLHSATKHWEEFQYVLDLLQPARQINSTVHTSFNSKKPFAYLIDAYAKNSNLMTWLSAESGPRYVMVAPRAPADPSYVLDSVAQAIWNLSCTSWMTCPPIIGTSAGDGHLGRASIYASLIGQILTQQPQAFLVIQHLVPRLSNAMTSPMQPWRERCLWLCLRTLLCSPGGDPRYGFFYVESKEAIQVLQEINSLLEKTETKVRMVLLIAPGTKLGIDDSNFAQLNLSDDLLDHPIDNVIANTNLTSAGQRSLILRTTQSSRTVMDTVLLGTLRSILPDLGRLEVIALTWIAFATRPLRLEELDLAIAQDQTPCHDFTSRISEGPSAPELVARLQAILPGLVETRSNLVVLCLSYIEVREILSMCLNSSLGEEWITDLYIAEKCLGLLKSAATTAHDKLTNNLIIYAAQNWIHHYELAQMSDEKLALGGIIHDEPFIESWLSFVEYLALPPSQRSTENCSFGISDPQLQDLLDIKNWDHLKILFSLANRPSHLPVAGRFLIFAAETSRQEILQAISAENILALPVEAVVRALATSHGSFHDELKKKANFLDEEAMSRVRLTAQVLGNTALSDSFSAELTLPIALQNGRMANTMRIALEYDDSDVIDEALRVGSWDAKTGEYDSLTALDRFGWSLLHTAAEHGSVEVVSKILTSRQQDEIETIASGSQSPLIIATAHGFYRVVELLLSAGIFVDGVEEGSDRTALHIASALGYHQTVGLLLQNTADVTVFDEAGDYPLHLAIRRGHAHIAEQLLCLFPSVPEYFQDPIHEDTPPIVYVDYNGDHVTLGSDYDDMNTGLITCAALDCANLKGVSILIEAAGQNMPQLCRMALDQGANPNFRDDAGRIALHLAAKSGSAGMVRDLLAAASVTSQGTIIDGCTPIHYGCYYGAVEVVDLLVSVSDLSLEDRWGRTPISAAAAAGNLDVVRLLHDYYNELGRVKALVAAARQCQGSIVEYLLDLGCPVDGVETTGCRLLPLLELDAMTDARMMQLLLRRGANPNLLKYDDRAGYTAIYRAAWGGAYEVVGLLIDRGAQKDMQSGKGDTPLSVAIFWRRPEIVRLLLERNTSMKLPTRWVMYSSLLQFAMEVSSRAVCAVLLDFYQKGKQEDGLTSGKALVYAMKRSRNDILELILDLWISLEGATEALAEAIHYAAMSGDVNALGRLVQHSVGKHAVNSECPGHPEHGTPLHAAMSHGRVSTVEILIKSGADPRMVSGKYGTILNAACASGDIDLVKKALALLSKDEIRAAAREHEHDTAFQWVMRGEFRHSRCEDVVAVLELLNEHGIWLLEAKSERDRLSTPLHDAAGSGMPLEVINWLLAKLPCTTLLVRDAAGRVPLSIAILQRTKWCFIKEMLDKSKHAATQYFSRTRSPEWIFFCRDGQNLTLLHYAVMSQSTDIVAHLLEQIKQTDVLGLVLDAADIDTWTPLHWACRRQNGEIVKLLMDNGANPTARTVGRWTPRHVAMLHGHGNSEHLAQLPDTGDSAEVLPDEPVLKDDGCCDFCMTELCWKYYRCVSGCYDFDLCFKCYRHAYRIHQDDHEFDECQPGSRRNM